MPPEAHGPDSLQNEAANIRECIESVRGVADEILVADSLSTDGTLDVVRELGNCRIIEREFVDYSNFNSAIPQASHPWVLVVDADERVTEPLADEMRGILGPGRSAAGCLPHAAPKTTFSAIKSVTAAGTAR